MCEEDQDVKVNCSFIWMKLLKDVVSDRYIYLRYSPMTDPAFPEFSTVIGISPYFYKAKPCIFFFNSQIKLNVL